ncbi:MAG: InlB B-repeat-containing protein [Bacteroidales bacterium]|nr:InlB B-repeat-containing protein [Bacteroidales bacterium]
MNSLTLYNNTDNNGAIATAAATSEPYAVSLANRTIYRDYSWNTICLPFDLNDFTGTSLENSTVKSLESSSFNDGVLTMSFEDATAIEAGKPYIFKSTNADLIINSAEDWDAFAAEVNNGTNTYQGKTVMLVADISVTTMVGNEGHPFCGTFDGCGHELTVNLTAGAYDAPFPCLNGATIRNLHTSGTISSNNFLNAGIAGRVYGSTQIENCHSSVSITSTKGDNAALAGIVGVQEAGALIVNNCLFDGSLLGSNNTNCAGLVNWKRGSGSTIISNSLFAPAEMTVSLTGATTFYRNTNGTTLTNCYYTRELGNVQGTAVGTMSSADLATALGDEWEVVGGNVVPKMPNSVSNIENPVFVGVTISTATNNVTTANADFVGNYAPFTGDSYILDAHNPNGDAVHAAISTHVTAPTGKRLDGWYEDDDLTIPASSIPFTTDGTVTMYAKWAPITYTVRFVRGSGATGTMLDQTFTYDEAQNLAANGFSRSGYVFAGWSTTPDGDVEYANEASVSNLSAVQGAVINLYAKWMRTLVLVENTDNNNAITTAAASSTTYAVVLSNHIIYCNDTWNTLVLPFDLNDFTGTPLQNATVKTLDGSTYNDGTLTMTFADATTIEAGKPFILKSEALNDADLIIRTDEDWDAFATEVSNGNTYQGKTVKLAADIRVVRVVGDEYHAFRGTFDGCGHTITLNLSGGYEDLAPFTAIADATIQNLKLDGTIRFSRHRPASITSYVEGNSTIRNCWSNVNIISNYSASDWVDAGAMVACVKSNATINLSDCLFTGIIRYNTSNYEGGGMVGWTRDYARANLRNCLFMPSSLIMSQSNEDTYIFVSGYVRGNLTNCFYNSRAGSSVLQNEGRYENGMSIADFLAVLGNQWEERSGIVVPKMPNNLDNIVNPVFMGVTVSTANNNTTTTYADLVGSYAPFTDNSYFLDAHNPDGYAIYAAISTHVTAPTGQTLEGWYEDDELTIPVTSIPFATDGTVTMYANWIPLTYTVHFDPNGDNVTGTMADMNFTYDEPQTLTTNDFRRPCYSFLGWSTTPSGDVEYTNEQSFNDLTAEQGEVIILYARWQYLTVEVGTESSDANYCKDETMVSDLSVSITGGEGTPTFQWYRNGTPISGATTDTYTPLTDASGDFDYSVKVYNNCGGDSIHVANIHIYNVFAVSSTSSDATYCKDETTLTELNVSVTGGHGTPTYQWYKNGTAISDANGASFTPFTDASGDFDYSVKVGNDCGSDSIHIANIHINPLPTISVSLDEQSIVYGNSITPVEITNTHSNVIAPTLPAGFAYDAMTQKITAVQPVVHNYTITVVAESNQTPNCGTESAELSVVVTQKPLTIKANSNEKVYDGTALTDNGYSIADGTSLVSTDHIHAVTVTGSQTAAGSSDNVPSGCVIYNASDEEVTANYDITYQNGTLTVTKDMTNVTIASASGSWVYDGETHTKQEYTVTYGSTNIPAIEGTDGLQFRLPTNDIVTIVPTFAGIKNYRDNAANNNVYTFNLPDMENNYGGTFTTNYGTLEITKHDLAISLDNTKVYDGYNFVNTVPTDGLDNGTTAAGDTPGGEPTTGTGWVIGGLQNGATITAGVVTSQRGDVAIYLDSVLTNYTTITTDFATSDDITNYNVIYDFKQEITPRPGVVVMIQEHGKEVEYNGTDQRVTGYGVSITDPVNLYSTDDFSFTGMPDDTVAHGTGSADALHIFNMYLRPSYFQNNNNNYVDVSFRVLDSLLYIYPKLQAEAATTQVFCRNGNNGTAEITVTGGKANNGKYTFAMDGVAVEHSSPYTFEGIEAGNYTVVVTDSLHYSVEVPFEITEIAELTAEIVTPSNLCPNQGSYPVSVTVNGGTSPYRYMWSGDATDMQDASTTVAQTGVNDGDQEYTVSVSILDAHDCPASDNVIFTVKPSVKKPGSVTYTCPNDTSITLRYGAIDTLVILHQPIWTNNIPAMPLFLKGEGLTDNNRYAIPEGLEDTTYVVEWHVKDTCGGDSLICIQRIMLSYPECSEVIINGISYPVTRIGGNCWIRENVRVAQSRSTRAVSGIRKYDNSDSLQAIYGNLYTWYTAMGVTEDDDAAEPAVVLGHVQGVCPDGWAIPTNTDFLQLVEGAGGMPYIKSTNADHWVSSLVGAEPSRGFDARGGGMYVNATDTYESLMTMARFWTCTPAANPVMGSSVQCAVCEDELLTQSKKDGCSLRCVKVE